MITITAGHSNTDSGAVNGKWQENKFVTNTRNYVVYYLRKAGIEVQTDGSGDDNKPLRHAISLASIADLAIEFHLNASANKSVHGVEILSQPRYKKISQDIAKAIVSVTGSKLRGDKGWKPENAGQHSRLGFVRAGGLIVELEFISNDEYMTTLENTHWLVAQAIADVIINYVKGKKYGS